ncbi:glycosyltransferase [Spirosoma fluviale]|uniref:Glycosyltransferase, catalytic subunit of cellulose synthase and poly-beta-1,6-N-acetylglucosamine synthase n=1 Tax=Spirosoma fluviale TaxID=1597977 RepID=A0A286FG54_9BACT|nr:glycosyltransferase [Spirosoma fluviale]SOD82200.1 Glycosyltransferase, catalytic subunit of cellulose synthase and poly-beta-1,6-N-acetylglucosamine synthase [Spirosoma fluviale]
MPVINTPDWPQSHQDTISILIAARNEEKTILACLDAIRHLNYPIDRLEVLIGNDQSTDQTASVITGFIQDKPAYKLIHIGESTAGLRGKANVLAQLAGQARGQLLFFTDADTQVPPDWLMHMSHSFRKQTGIVTGVTLPEGPKIFHKLQTIDWLYNLTLTHLVSSMGLPVTAMGNNMAVSREGYRAAGGYESLPFSVVEDYALFKAITAKGYGFANLLNEDVLARTKAVDTLHGFLHQRKRWMRGASQLPVWMVGSLYLQYLAAPLFLLLTWVSPVLAVGLYVARLFVQTMIISFGLSRLRQTNLWPYALLFEIYQLIIGPLAVVFYLMPTKIEWKGRHYT